MSLGFSIIISTGRTYCRCCNFHLQKGQLAIKAGASRASGQMHFRAEDCTYLQRKLRELK